MASGQDVGNARQGKTLQHSSGRERMEDKVGSNVKDHAEQEWSDPE